MLASVAICLAGCVALPVGLGGGPTPTPFRIPLVTSRPPTPTPSTAPQPSPSSTPQVRPTPADGSPTIEPGASPTPPRISTEGACGDDAYNLSGYVWEGTYDWYFHRSSTPSDYDPFEVLEVLERSVANITNAFNDCGLPDTVDIEARYRGITTDVPCEGEIYALNVIGFGSVPDRLGRDTIAYTCPYEDNFTGDYVEADIVINHDVAWALSEESCRPGEELLEATVTHEVGHVFGLDHVSERRHGDLTMSTRSNGPCTLDEITLGLGDILGLEELYGSP